MGPGLVECHSLSCGDGRRMSTGANGPSRRQLNAGAATHVPRMQKRKPTAVGRGDPYQICPLLKVNRPPTGHERPAFAAMHEPDLLYLAVISGLGVCPMRRREFITLLGSAAATWPLAARAQQATKMPAIGILGSGTPATQGHWYAAFVQRLRELGWIDGRTVAIEYRWAEGRDERAAEIAAEFVRRKVDVIVTSATAGVVAAKQATSVIPIVFAAAGDPVGTGLVASLARP